MKRMIVVLLFLIGCGKGSDKAAVEPTAIAAPDAAVAVVDEAGLHAKCCAQCSGAAGRDPAGMDISVKQCTSYRGAEFNGGPGVDEACFVYFQSKRTILRDCQQTPPPVTP